MTRNPPIAMPTHKTWRRGVDVRVSHHVGRRGALENLIDILVGVAMIEHG